MGLTRRRFIDRVALAGGYGAAYVTMQQLGLLPMPVAYAGPPDLAPGSGTGTSVVILGAGLAGMTAAYELGKAGYDCRILEASDRAGGRCWTIRRGTRVEEIKGEVQTCSFDDGLYFNAGPARIPAHHRAILGYCKAFGVDLEVFVNTNRGALFHDDYRFDGKPIESRALYHDFRGYVAELLAKALDTTALDDALTPGDKQSLGVFLRGFGDLDKDAIYRGTSRAGYATPPGAGLQAGEPRAPFDLSVLLNANFWSWKMHKLDQFDLQATMLQPVGGMDRIAAAFERRVGDRITYGAEVTQIRRAGDRTRIVYRDRTSGAETAAEADYCICTIPLAVLRDIESDFSEQTTTAISRSLYVESCKLAWQADRRFWEEDSGIYGGISWTERDITQIWYPSSGFHGDKGILIGAYNYSLVAQQFGNFSPSERADRARESGRRIHPEFENEVSRAVSVAWQNMPHARGAWTKWSSVAREKYYPALTRADGPFYFAGEHVSYLRAWQEGAILSAHHSIAALHRRVQSSGG